MTNDLKNFLEEKKKEFESQFVTKNTNDWDRLKGVRSQEPLNWINDVILDTHNFVLDLVEREVDKIEVKKFGRYTIEKDAEEIINTIVNETKKCVSTIINNLRV